MSGTTHHVMRGRMENMTHDTYDRNGDGCDRTALQNLQEYINGPNHLREYEKEVNKLLQAVSEEIEQVVVKTKAEIEKTIIDFERRLKESETHRDRYRNERNDLRKILSTFSKERQQKISNDQELAFKREIANIENTLEQKEKDWAKKLKDLEETSDDIIKDQKKKIEEMQNQTKMQEMEIKSLQEKLEQNRFGFSGRRELEKKLEESQKQLNDTNDKLHRALTKLKHAERELDETKTRLSKAMGDKLTNNNPNVADLSDKDRPTKLAERYAELYDNQWTDAYEIIECHFGSEEEVIQTLLGILMNVMEFCKSQAKLQMEKLHKTLTFSTNEGDEPVPDNITKQLKDMRKALSSTAKLNLYQEYIDRLRVSRDQTLRQAMEIKSFVKECVETCWLMAIQDPPIVICPIPRNGDVLNTEMYKPYMRSGRLIQFVVWPALLLHDSGPVLAKGVAQGVNERHERPIETWIDKTNKSGVLQENYGLQEKGVYEKGRYLSTRYDTPLETNYCSGITYENKRYGTYEHRHYRTHSAGHTRPSYQQSTVMTTTVDKETNTRKLSNKTERSPTQEEMTPFLRYPDRFDYVGAINRHGICQKRSQREYRRHLYN